MKKAKRLLRNRQDDRVGVVYCVDGPVKFLHEAIISAQTFKHHHPETPIAVATASPQYKHPVFDTSVELEPNSPFSNKVFGVSNSPFSQTIFLDTDTLILQPVHDLYAQFETEIRIGLDWSIVRDRTGALIDYKQTSKYNTGVFVTTSQSGNLLDRWRSHIEGRVRSRIDRGGGDQPSFNDLALKSSKGLTIDTLDSFRFNLRYDIFQRLTNIEQAKTNILHDHGISGKLRTSELGRVPSRFLKQAIKDADIFVESIFHDDCIYRNLEVVMHNIQKVPDVPAYYRQLNDYRRYLPREKWKETICCVLSALREQCSREGANPGLSKMASDYYWQIGDLEAAEDLLFSSLSSKPKDITFWRSWVKLRKERTGVKPTQEALLKLAKRLNAPHATQLQISKL